MVLLLGENEVEEKHDGKIRGADVGMGRCNIHDAWTFWRMQPVSLVIALRIFVEDTKSVCHRPFN